VIRRAVSSPVSVAFRALAAYFALVGAALAQPAEAYDLARRFAGDWQEFTVTPEGERLEGTLRSTFDAGGCAITQTFESADGGFTFRSLGYVEAASGQWIETYVLSNGRVASYRWRVDGEDVVIDRIGGGDPASRRRLRVTFLGPDAYRVIEESSPAGKEHWTGGTETMTRRIR
jgi:hypothetical protein